MSFGEHLQIGRRKFLDFTDDDRMAEIQADSVYVEYPQAYRIKTVLNNILKTTDRVQAPCLLVSGEGGTGKSSIINQIKVDPVLSTSLVFMALNVNPYNLKFGELLADALGVPQGAAGYGRSKRELLPSELGEVIRLRQKKGIVIDELHDAMLVPRPEQHRNLSMIKGLSNAPYSLTVVGFGTTAAKHSLSFDPQLSRRFYKIDLEDWGETESFRSFLAGVEENLPLRHVSNLDGPEIVGYLLERTGGRMDDVMKIIKSAACYAIRSGEEKITLNNLNKAFSFPWSY